MPLEAFDDHIIGKFGDHKMLLRPGATRRLSFRGTPGGEVTVRVITDRGPGLGDTEEPLDEGPSVATGFADFVATLDTAAGTGASGRPVQPRGPESRARDEALLATAILAAPLGTSPSEGGGAAFGEEGRVAAMAPDSSVSRPPILSMDDLGDIIIVGPDEPVRPPEPQPRPPIEVSVEVRDGDVLGSETLQQESVSPARMRAGPFPEHDVIEVVYTNSNEFPLLVTTFVHVQNDLEISATELPRSMLERVFGNTLLWLAPTIGIEDGELRFSFSEEAMGPLGMEPVTRDVGVDVDVGVTIEPISFELLSHEDVVEELVSSMEADLDSILGAHPVLSRDLLPADFVSRTVDAYFSTTMTLPFLFEETMGLPGFLWEGPLEQRPMLKGPAQHSGQRDDAALAFDLRMTEIAVGASVLRIAVDTVTARLLVVLRSGSRPEPHPVDFLRDDFVRAGAIVPRYHLTVDIGDIDVDLEIADGPERIVVAPFEFVAEEALEEAADWMRDDFEDEAVDLGMAYLEDSRLRIGELATQIMNEIADREHFFRRLRTDAGWTIETLDPAQLAVPFVEPDPVDHRFDDIDVSLEPVEPIDGPLPSEASEQLGRVDHLVFVMMENRSFDHFLGYLSHPNHGQREDVDGLDGQSVALGGDFEGTTATPQSGPRESFIPDPGHGVETVEAQINGGRMDGFVSEFIHRMEDSPEINMLRGNLRDPERILRFHTADQLSFYQELADEHMVLDRWFSSVPGPTYPNRFCYYSGLTPLLSNREIFADAGYQEELTFLDILDREGVEWICYESDFTFIRVYEPYRLETERIRPFDELESRREALPPVTLIDPNYTGPPGAGPPNDDHPPTSIAEGQAFIQGVVDLLMELPEWEQTMLVITYDEHGGFADHVPPPGSELSDFPPASDGTPSVPLAHPDVASYGVRVPTFVVSPLVAGGDAGHGIYDHASVFRTVVERFTPDLVNSAIIPERVRRARHLGELVEPGAPREVALEPPAVSLAAPAPRPDAVIHRNSDEYRPHLAPPPGIDDFHHFVRRFGNPIVPQ